MKIWIYFYVFCASRARSLTISGEIADSDLTITQIITKYGYPVETHEIATEDGYLLDVYRLPYGHMSSTNETNRYPVVITHGLMGSAENFILRGPNKSLAYMLADNGYDVWLFNARGSWHSRKHRTLDPDRDRQFWQFTWHEIGVYDIPATIDYILNITKKEKIHYVGHSQGTTSFFAMCSERPEYNNKINIMIALAPSAILKHFKHPILKFLAPLYPLLERLAHVLNINELVPFNLNREVRTIGKSICGHKISPYFLCSSILFIVAGYEPEQLEKATIPLIVATAPAGSSTKQALHYAQIVTKGKFTQYDWGRKENMRRYKSETPPQYKLNHVLAPVAIFYGESDILVAKEDVAILANILPNVVDLYKVPYEKWTHTDFIWAKDIDILLNKRIVQVMKRYNYK